MKPDSDAIVHQESAKPQPDRGGGDTKFDAVAVQKEVTEV